MKSLLHAPAILFLATGIAPASEPSTFDRTLPVSGPVDLEVRTGHGGITVTAGSDGTVRVHAVIRSVYGRFDFGASNDEIRALEQNPPIKQTGNRIEIGAIKNIDLLDGVSMTLEIEVPRATTVHARTDSGGIKVDGVDGPVNTQSSSGETEVSNVKAKVDVASHSGAVIVRNTEGHVAASNESGGIKIAGIRGSVNAETTSGSTEISDISGEVHSSVHSGSLSIDNAKGTVTAHNSSGSIDAFQLAGAVDAETKSGAIRIAQINPAAIRARADSGAITVELAGKGGYRIDAQSDSGKVSGPTMKGPEQIAEDHRLRGQIGTGGPLVDLDTQSSKIEVN